MSKRIKKTRRTKSLSSAAGSSTFSRKQPSLPSKHHTTGIKVTATSCDRCKVPIFMRTKSARTALKTLMHLLATLTTRRRQQRIRTSPSCISHLKTALRFLNPTKRKPIIQHVSTESSRSSRWTRLQPLKKIRCSEYICSRGQTNFHRQRVVRLKSQSPSANRSLKFTWTRTRWLRGPQPNLPCNQLRSTCSWMTATSSIQAE